VGIWNDRLLPRCIDRMMRTDDIDALRRRVCEGLTGTVVAIGFGSGLDLPWMPAGVDRVLAVEPSAVARRLAAPRIAAAAAAVAWSGLDGEGLPFADATCDSALSTFTLCTIPRVDQALRELHRVLKPNGRLHFLEHGLAEAPAAVRWQHRLDRLQGRCFGGCHLVRPIDELVAAAGFDLERCERLRLPGPATHGSLYLGVAVRPS
jgi:ubiquinone/menaquinone biosynthesis C-methylase UbiE